MRATESLSSDHRLIERVITAMDAAADRLEAGLPLRPQFFQDVVRFIREYADGAHHRKEEDALFPALAAQGMPVEGGPIAVMLYEHARGRELTAALHDAAARHAAGEPGALPALLASARGYAGLLRQHIYKEDNILFPMAAQVLPPEAQQSVMERFEAIDRARPEGSSRDDYGTLVERLERDAG